MFKEIIEYILSVALRHKAVRYGRYMGRKFINEQNSHGYMQFVIEDDPYTQRLLEKNLSTMTLNIDILGFPRDGYGVADAQSDAFQIAHEVMAFIEADPAYQGLLSVHDYSLLSVARFDDNESAGQRLTLEIVIPDATDLCTLADNFDDEPHIEPAPEDTGISEGCPAPSEDVVLKPIRLKRT